MLVSCKARSIRWNSGPGPAGHKGALPVDMAGTPPPFRWHAARLANPARVRPRSGDPFRFGLVLVGCGGGARRRPGLVRDIPGPRPEAADPVGHDQVLLPVL